MKTKKEFERVALQTVGISVKAIMKLLDQLEGEYTEIHSIMVCVMTRSHWKDGGPRIRRISNI